ncbi:MarR family transcriptional regulator [Marinomonas ushuaiensis DSM 15871]|uniref:MarR family transcriptional regulator n=1 Tax=Marinomonas ushuaiensis DSM 15871 TaxID=1122207 RepID=X7E8C3_9GAMM|nr:MarR family transcriptional regulator [Marinomonas ushuaiensis]ETX12110.1 MarR family transcriptional regulator [Marinomonas ushuaiensis DSM 15871]
MSKKTIEGSHDSGLPDEVNYVFTEQVGHLLRKAHQRHMMIFQEMSCEPNLTAPQFIALCTIQSMVSCSITDIVSATTVDQATMRGVIDRLKSKGWVYLSADLKDRRKVMISLSDAGSKLLDAMIPCAKSITEATMSGLNPAERVALIFLLKKMTDTGK